MRASDLIGSPVVDQSGRGWGFVRDIHLVQDGPVQASGLAALRLYALIVGPRALGTSLGYSGPSGPGAPRRVERPFVMRALMRVLNRRAVQVPWDTVTAVERHRVLVDAPAGGFPQAYADVVPGKSGRK